MSRADSIASTSEVEGDLLLALETAQGGHVDVHGSLLLVVASCVGVGGLVVVAGLSRR